MNSSNPSHSNHPSRAAIIRPAIVLFAVRTLITGIIYPLAVTGIAQLAFPSQASGSLVRGADGTPVGSSLIGQEFAAPGYFWGRLSATGPVPYSPLNTDKSTGSSGSNYAPSNPALADAAKARLAALAAADAAAGFTRPAGQSVPVDLVTASGSGLDPHVSPAAIAYQLPRVAKARGMTEQAVQALIGKHTTERTFGLLGEPVVNVLLLNLDLDRAATAASPAATSSPTPASSPAR
jgi:K+-transporting ATPase ATPase C chain